VSDWRIDELAQRAGVAVDTIRYYQREGLLATGERAGRSLRYGPQHLERLERIRALQTRRFSLAAIGALLDRDEPGALEDILAGAEGATYDHDELVEAAGVPAELARELTDAGMLRDPVEHGRSVYDAADLKVLRAFADLRAVAVPDAILVEIARTYAEGLERIQRRVAAMLAGFEGPHWQPDEHERFLHAVRSPAAPRIAHDVRVIADYTQQRNLQRLLLQALELNRTKARARAHEHPPSDL
jgi:DNA-binding transcriptional MerR regulator